MTSLPATQHFIYRRQAVWYAVVVWWMTAAALTHSTHRFTYGIVSSCKVCTCHLIKVTPLVNLTPYDGMLLLPPRKFQTKYIICNSWVVKCTNFYHAYFMWQIFLTGSSYFLATTAVAEMQFDQKSHEAGMLVRLVASWLIRQSVTVAWK